VSNRENGKKEEKKGRDKEGRPLDTQTHRQKRKKEKIEKPIKTKFKYMSARLLKNS